MALGSAQLLTVVSKVKVKIKVTPRTDHEVPKGEWIYNSTLSLILELYWGRW